MNRTSLFDVEIPDVPADLDDVSGEDLALWLRDLGLIKLSIEGQLSSRRSTAEETGEWRAFKLWKGHAILKIRQVEIDIIRLRGEMNWRAASSRALANLGTKPGKVRLYPLLWSLALALREWPEAPEDVRHAAAALVEALGEAADPPPAA